MKRKKINPDQGSLPGLEAFQPETPNEVTKFEDSDAKKDDEPSSVDLKYPLPRLIGIVCVRSRTEGSSRARLNIHTPEEVQQQLNNLEQEATKLIFEEGKWQEAIDSGLIAQEDVNDLMLELYERLYKNYTGAANKLKREKTRRFLKKKR